MESSAIVVVADGIKATGGGGEAIATCGVGEAIATCDGGDVATAETQKTKKLKNKNRIHVSHTKRPFFFYCNLAKVYTHTHERTTEMRLHFISLSGL